MLLCLTGASGAGKSTVLKYLQDVDWGQAVTCVEFDSIGVPDGADTAWRHSAIEQWVQRALDAQARGEHLFLFGQVPMGELLAAPSAERLEDIAVCMLHCSGEVRSARLRARGGPEESLIHHVRFGDWFLAHTLDPTHAPEVIRVPSATPMRWDRWQGWSPGDSRWTAHVIDTDALVPHDVARQVETWARAQLVLSLPEDTSHRGVESLMRDAGWESCGAGDWAIALAAPSGEVVARISPFDPVGPYTARLYREAAGTGRVPAIYAHRRLAGGGDVQILEKLTAVGADEAALFLKRLTSGDAELSELAAITASLHRDAQRELPWCGPLDSNPSNVMRTRSGRLVLTDPYYADGPSLYATAEAHPEIVAGRIPEGERRFMTEIPLACSGPWSLDDREAMREALAREDARAETRARS